MFLKVIGMEEGLREQLERMEEISERPAPSKQALGDRSNDSFTANGNRIFLSPV